MAKQLEGGVVSDEAAAVLDLLEKASGKRRSRLISDALEEKGKRTFGRSLTVIHKEGSFNGWFANSFNWFNKSKFVLILRSRIGPVIAKLKPIKPAAVFAAGVWVGALGLAYYVFALGG
jgi:hypothetical protein